jgi:hypothetical protein
MCLPTSVPEAIVLDVSELGLRESLSVKDAVAKYPEVEFLNDLETTLANVMPPALEKVEEEDEAAVAEGATEPEVVGEEKKEGESEE